ncbi:2OG-Fe dioxygenase family protein [Caldimonas sp.]|uniref:2OG-Fe dioxygenase family protein n=1 Tax=Caldimonas sp. TaxID=2838790 RepID=UPI003918EF4E
MLLPAPLTPPTLVEDALRERGFAVLDAAGLAAFSGVAEGGFADLSPLWDDLPADAYLRDGGRYRRRRHACLVVEGGRHRTVPHRAHWQPVEYNALHGGLERWFEPVSLQMLEAPAFLHLIHALARCASRLKGEQPWYVEVHQFRIDTTDGIGRPTPEGAHRDGVDLVAVVLVARSGIKGGETRVFEAHGSHGIRFTLTEPWSALLLDDERVIHESTPIQPLDGPGHRDTLVVTLRARGFQGP